MSCTACTAQVAKQYLECVQKHDGEAKPCAELSRIYLQCRMDR